MPLWGPSNARTSICFWGYYSPQPPAKYPQMALKKREVRYATKRLKDYKLADGEGLYLAR